MSTAEVVRANQFLVAQVLLKEKNKTHGLETWENVMRAVVMLKVT